MLMELITNVLMRYLLTGENPKGAFLYIVGGRDAAHGPKVSMLVGIVNEHPEILKEISGDEILQAFRNLAKDFSVTKDVLTCHELGWAEKYVKDFQIRLAIETIIYSSLLNGSDYHDKMRQNFKWSLSKEAIKALITHTLYLGDISSSRRVDLAKELGMPRLEDTRRYFKVLINDGHLDAPADALGLTPKDVELLAIEIITDKLNSGFPCDIDAAIEIAQRFLPNRLDINEELLDIKEKVSARC